MPRISRVRPRTLLRVEPLDNRDVPAFLSGAELIAGADAGAPPVIRLLDPSTQAIRAQVLAFETTFTGGVRVAVGDVNGDSHPDLIVGAGLGGGPAIKVYDGKTAATLASFFAYEPSFTGGVYVAAGDVDGDGKAEIITGAGIGGGPSVSVFDGTTGISRGAGFAYDSSLRSGVRVASGDTNGDGKAEIITGPGVGGGPDVRVFRFGIGAQQPLQSLLGFYAYVPSFSGGVHVAAGDTDGDGRAEIVTGAGSGGGPQVSVFTGEGRSLTAFLAYASDFRGGVRVAVAEMTGDKKAEIITGPGPGGGPQMNVYSLPASGPTTSMFGLPSDQMVGIFVAGSGKTLNVPSVSDFVVNDAFKQVNAIKEQERLAAEQAQKAAEAAYRAKVAAQTPVIIVNQTPNYYNPYAYNPFFVPFFGTGLTFGMNLFGGRSYYDTTYYDSTYYAPTYYDPIDYGYSSDFGSSYFSDPGYYDPSGYDISDYGYDF